MASTSVSGEPSTEVPAIDALRKEVLSIVAPNFCHGVLPLDNGKGRLFYARGEESEARFIDFAKAVTEEDIRGLVGVCQPATFGRGEQDVFDETYRKAWKLDAAQFAAQFDIVGSGIMTMVHDQLLHGEMNTTKLLDAELYKLNIYGPGSFFKPHVDIPRTEKLFASLVVVLPTVHAGGNLLLGKDGEIFDFDSSQRVFNSDAGNAPQIAFAAFYSDLEHQVMPVSSGYRITLTYNLYISDAPRIPKPLTEHPVSTLANALASFLSDPTVLADGGALGFGLSYRYPINPKATNLTKFTGVLKGNDAVVRNACELLGFKASVKVLHSYSFETWTSRGPRKVNSRWVFDAARSGGGLYLDSDSPSSIHRSFKRYGKLILDDKSNVKKDAIPTLWITAPKKMVTSDLAVMAYGNEYNINYIYGDLVLFTEVPSFIERAGNMLGIPKLDGGLRQQLKDAMDRWAPPEEEGASHDKDSDESESDDSLSEEWMSE